MTKRIKFEERIDQVVESVEKKSGERTIRAVGITAGVVNGNRRRYPRDVVADAVNGLNENVNQSPGSGRLIALGEPEHPSSRGARPSLLETVVKWQAAELGADDRVILEGIILPTTKGKDVQTLIEHGVPVGVSMRGYGHATMIEEGGERIQQVDQLTITGFDLVLEPSDPYARLLESLQEMEDDPNMSTDKQQAGPVENLEEAVQARLDAEEAKRRIAELEESLKTAQAAQVELEERKRQEEIEEAIAKATADLMYGDLNTTFVEAVRNARPASAKAVQALVEAKQVEYDAMMSKAKLVAMGKASIDVRGPVFERETGQPEFTRGAFLFTERLAERGKGKIRDFREAKTPGELLAKRYLDEFDKVYGPHLIEESRLVAAFEEAEQTSDLNLPYSVSRTVIAEVVPELVAANVFDFDMADTSPTRIYFEAYSAESGAQPTVSSESVTAVQGSWVDLANKRIQPGSVTVSTKTEYTDYLIDYANGRIYAITTGGSWSVDYTYDKVRAGEMGAIQRGKGTLSYQTVELAADRLAQQISDEAVVFGRSQLGWDATTRTLSMLIRELREMIDTGAIRLAIAQAHISGNTGGTWTSGSDALSVLVEKMGVAKVAVQNDNYEPTSFLASLTNADKIENYLIQTTGTLAGNIAANRGVLGAGDTGIRIKGLPLFASKHMPDNKVIVQHREAVQHRVLRSKPMMMKGPFASYSNGNLVAAEQYYVEEYNGTFALIANKAGYVTIA